MTWAPSYTEVTDLRVYIRDELAEDETDEVGDAYYAMVIDAASRAIDRACSRQFGVDDEPTTRVYTARYDPRTLRYWVGIDDLFGDAEDIVVTDLAADAEVTDYRLVPLNAEAKGKPYEDLHFGGTVSVAEGKLQVEAVFGWSAIPSTIKLATLIQSARWVKRRDAPFGVAGSPDLGNELRLLAKLDVDVAVMVQAYRRYW